MLAPLVKTAHQSMLGLALASAAFFWVGIVSSASADTMADRQDAAVELVHEALHRELFGQDEDRAALLEAALQQRPDYLPAMWHQGRVQLYRDWVNASDVPELLADDLRLARYHIRRDNTEDTPAGHFELAQWCRQADLTAQARAHLFRVIELNPNHLQAREALQFQRIDNRWISQEELAQTRQEMEELSAAFSEWRDRIESLRTSLNHRSLLRQDVASQRILAIDDPRAIVALENILAPSSPRASALVIEVLSAMPHPKASVSLARIAVLSPYVEARTLASERLIDRNWDTFVPALLSELYTPIESQTQVALEGGRLIYRHSFFRQGQEASEMRVLETSYRRLSLPGGNEAESLNRALQGAEQLHSQRERELAEQNEFTRQLNERIAQALSVATGQTFGEPTQWWNWWNQYNEVYLDDEKTLHTSIDRTTINVEDKPVFFGGGAMSGGGQSSSGGSSLKAPPMDCLVEGTLIQTSRGPVPVEQVQVGDMVLSQDPLTGELNFQPVLCTTERPAGEILRIYAGSQVIESSGGHPFWVSGEGWVKARELQSGSELHTVNGTLRISCVDEGAVFPTYNLVVDRFHTYFIGPDFVLSHDNTVRQPVPCLVPGLPMQ